MQGTVFTVFSEMVIQKFGMTYWNQLIEESHLSSGGAYTSVEQYDDQELFTLVKSISNQQDIPLPTLLEGFGEYLFPQLFPMTPKSLSHIHLLKDYILSIENVIHVEVQRLYPDSYLPTFEYEEINDTELIVYYQSKRKLCHVAIGLLKGASKHFNQEILLQQLECMHQGHDKCKIHLVFGSTDE